MLDIDPVHLELVRDGMVGVVNEKGGTAVRSALTLPNVQMAGKTGTSQVISAKNGGFLKGWEGETHALFIAYAPTAAPATPRLASSSMAAADRARRRPSCAMS